MVWENTNKLLIKKNWYGIKTGHTDTAGPCLAGSVKLIDQKKLIEKHFVIVLLKCKSMDGRWDECEKIA